MLQAVQYPDMKVVEGFQQGTDLVGCVEPTGLWLKKFQPAVISVHELMHVAEMEQVSNAVQNMGQNLLNRFGRRRLMKWRQELS